MDRLVILAPNWLGDAVMALPAIADVRRAAPAATIAVAARPAIAPLFRLVPGVNETIVLERPVSIVNAARWHELGVEIGGKGFDTALLLPNSIHAALLATRAGIPNVWGYRTGWRGALLTRAIRRTSGLHQVEYYQQLVHALGFPNGPIEPRASVPADARAAAARVLTDAGWDGRSPLVALAPGAAYGGAKRWPPAYFAELARALSADGVRCLMIGSGADSAAGGEVARAFPTFARGTSERATAGIEPIIDLIGRTDLPALAGVLAHCRTLVTNDSGAMHLAAAVGVGVTAVFGPTDERATRPMGDGHEVLTHSVWCRPCMLRECPIDHRCMRGIGVAAVLGAARRTL
ncbi:MAG TPA: lipopolysaccharide heptosyltransferase II [Vicinamibacterales bacterium]|nr:MAG: lipopolysaccharide heptosyltransferase II [Acidobacteriota bacterium]PYR23166.1 MAG: lipopolysaccharide heptosyltransferase II [Acidobacteriota bacterium]PYR51135.1 MAG: lipopolysaccharide heptosyltransferase II [Acidobacteriota bacterium]HMD36095.1 lipopolysaccharide heptosyltransferase II [Vicinamibacterales bacterium]